MTAGVGDNLDGQQRDGASDAADVADRLVRLEAQFAEIQRLAQLGSWEWDIPASVVAWSDELYRM